jgi:hypothetical protein
LNVLNPKKWFNSYENKTYCSIDAYYNADLFKIEGQSKKSLDEIIAIVKDTIKANEVLNQVFVALQDEVRANYKENRESSYVNPFEQQVDDTQSFGMSLDISSLDADLQSQINDVSVNMSPETSANEKQDEYEAVAENEVNDEPIVGDNPEVVTDENLFNDLTIDVCIDEDKADTQEMLNAQEQNLVRQTQTVAPTVSL